MLLHLNRHYNNITYMSTDNALKLAADDYLRKHRIIELMEDLCSDLCYEQPQNINDFLIDRLKNKQKQGNPLPTQDSKQAFSAKKKSPTSSPSSTSNAKASSTKNAARKPSKLSPTMSSNGNKYKPQDSQTKSTKKAS